MAHLIQTLSMAPLVSVSTGFSCISDLQIMPFHLILIPLLNTEGFNKSHNWPARPVILKWNAVELPESNHPSLHEKWKESQEKEEGRGKEGSIFLVNLWKLMTVSNFGACTQAWQARWVVFKIVGFVCKHFLPFFPIPSPLFYSPHSPPRSFTHPTFARSLSLIPSSLHGNCMEVLATQSNWGLSVLGFFFLWVLAQNHHWWAY